LFDISNYGLIRQTGFFEEGCMTVQMLTKHLLELMRLEEELKRYPIKGTPDDDKLLSSIIDKVME